MAMYNPLTCLAGKFPRGYWSFLGPGSEEKWYGTYTDRTDGSWNQSAENMMANFSGSGHPIFRASSAFERGKLRSKGGGKKSIHFDGSHENIELLLRTVISANQLCVYGAITDLCYELSEDYWASEKPDAPDHVEKMEIPTDLSIAEHFTSAQQRGNLVQEYERKFEQLSEDQKLSKLCSDASWKLVERGQYFHTRDTEEGKEMQHICREYTMSRNEKKTRARGWILKITRIGSVLDIKICRLEDQYSIEVLVQSLFQDRTASRVRIVNGVDK